MNKQAQSSSWARKATEGEGGEGKAKAGSFSRSQAGQDNVVNHAKEGGVGVGGKPCMPRGGALNSTTIPKDDSDV